MFPLPRPSHGLFALIPGADVFTSAVTMPWESLPMQSWAQLSTVLVVFSAWRQGKRLLSMGAAHLAPVLYPAGRGSGICLGFCKDMGHVDGWEGWENR